MKRGYLVTSPEVEWCVPVVAHSVQEAKIVVWRAWKDELDCAWIEVKVTWCKHASVSDLPYGIRDDPDSAWSRHLIDGIHG